VGHQLLHCHEGSGGPEEERGLKREGKSEKAGDKLVQTLYVLQRERAFTFAAPKVDKKQEKVHKERVGGEASDSMEF